MKPAELNIDVAFRDLLPKPTDDELEQLERSLIHEGCRDPLVVWNGTLLDGHNRYALCKKHGLVFKTKEIEQADKQTASLWIIANQLGRRNLHPNHYAYYLGKRYEVEKKAEGRPNSKLRHNDGVKGETASKLAAEAGKAERTVERNADFARGVDLLESAVPGSKAEILNGKHALTKGQIQKVAKLAKVEDVEAVKAKLAKAKEEPSEMEKLLREGEKKAYPWTDVDCLTEAVEAIEKLQAVPWKRVKEYVTKSPTGICLLKERKLKKLARFFTDVARRLETTK